MAFQGYYAGNNVTCIPLSSSSDCASRPNSLRSLSVRDSCVCSAMVGFHSSAGVDDEAVATAAESSTGGREWPPVTSSK